MNLQESKTNESVFYSFVGLPNTWVSDNDRTYKDNYFKDKTYEDFYFDSFYDMDKEFGHENSLFGTRGLPVGHPKRKSSSFDMYHKQYGPAIVRVVKDTNLQETIRRVLIEESKGNLMKIKSIKVINGKNKWSESKDKLIHMVLDLGVYESRPSNKIEGFYERIKEHLPSLKSHRCSVGKIGGFLSRVKEGTWMGHIIEHVALELQTLAGMDTGWGRTRGVKGQKGVYNVVFNYEDKDKGKLAAREAFNVVNDIIENRDPQIDKIVKKLKPKKKIQENIRRILREEISAKEAYSTYGSIKTIIDGKRDVAFIELNNIVNRLLISLKSLKKIKVPSSTESNYIVYREGSEKEAQELYDIAMKYDGSLSYIASEEDSRRIGQILGYRQDDIEDYIKHNKKIRGITENIQRIQEVMGLNEQITSEFDKQLQWWKSYLNSPMYLERLKKEFPNKPQDFLEKERKERLKNLDNVKTQTHFVNAISKDPGYISGLMIPKNYEGQYYDYKEKKWKQNKWTPDAKGYDKKGHVYFEKEYNPKNWNPVTGFETIPAHEFGHLVDDGGVRIPQSTKEKIYKYTQGGNKKYPSYKSGDKVFDYESTPSEFINRIQPIRYLLNQQGIYDARKKQFTKDDYNKMIKNPTILQNQHYKDVFQSLKGTDQEKMNNFIDLMNTVAMKKNNDSSSLNNFT